MKILLLLLPFLFAGCSELSSSLEKENQKSLNEARYASTAEWPVLNSLPSSYQKDYLLRLNSNVRLSSGMWSEYDQALKFGEDLVNKTPQADSELDKLSKENKQIQKDKENLESKLIQLGKEKEIENNKTIVSRIWSWGLGTFGLLGTVAFFVFCPTIAIPIGWWLLKTLPHVIWWFVSKIENMVEVTVKTIGAKNAKS